jgi:hypothetical protein
MNFNELVGLKQAFGPDMPEQAKYYSSRVPSIAENQLEIGILNKYNTWNISKIKASANVLRMSGKDIILDDLVDNDQHKEKLLMETCPGVSSRDQAKFWLEAAGYDLKEAENLFKTSQKPNEQVKITLNMSTGHQIVKFYRDFQQIWEIASEVYGKSGQTFDFSVFIEELSRDLNVAQMMEMTFKDLGLKSLTFVVLT